MGNSFLTRFITGTIEVPKTTGVIFDLTETDFNGLNNWLWSDALTVFKITKKEVEDVRATAKGKVVFIDRSTEIPQAICFQANGKSAEPAWCGNSYAAVAAYLSRFNGSGTINFNAVNNHLLEVSAKVQKTNESSYSISQNWQVEKRYLVNDAHRIFGHRTIFVKFFNEYRVVILKCIEDYDACLEKLAEKISALRLTDKICLLHPASGKVAFVTASYIHGAAPITGLVTLSLLKQKVSWFAERMTSNTVTTPSGKEHLPEVYISANTIGVNINDINVNLKNL